MEQAILRGDPIRETWVGDLGNLSAALGRTAHLHPSRGILFIEKDLSEQFISYETLHDRAVRMASGLQVVKRGTRVILHFDLVEDYVVAFWAVLARGGVPVPFGMPKRYSRDDRIGERILAVCRDLPEMVILSADPRLEELRRFLSENGLDDCTVVAPEARPVVTEYVPVVVDAADTAVLLQSSGSTSAPKIIPQSHRNILARTAGSIQMNGFTDQDRCLNCFPLDHVVGLIMCHFKDTLLGCEQIITDPSLFFAHPPRLLEWCDRFNISVTWAPHSALNMLLSHRDEISSRRWDLTPLRFLENCAEPIVFDQCKELLTELAPYGLRPDAIKPSWGMAETCSVTVIAHDIQSVFQRENASYTAVGKPFPGINVRILTDDGDVARTGEVGRLQVQGPTVLTAYWNRAGQLDFDGDWFETGDQAVITRNMLTIVGRNKDVIIVNGNNFAAYEFERAIDQVAGVVRSLTAVAPVRYAEDATDRVAVFVCRDGQVADDDRIVHDIVEAMTVRLGVSPDYVSFLDHADVPKTSVGKIQKSLLANRLGAGDILPAFSASPTAQEKSEGPAAACTFTAKPLARAPAASGASRNVVLAHNRASTGLVRDCMKILKARGHAVAALRLDHPSFADRICRMELDTFDFTLLDAGGPDEDGAGLDCRQLLRALSSVYAAKPSVGGLVLAMRTRTDNPGQPGWDRMGHDAVLASFAEHFACRHSKSIRLDAASLSAADLAETLCDEILTCEGRKEIVYVAGHRTVGSWRTISASMVTDALEAGSTALVTGALGGVGQLIVESLLSNGCAVLLTGRRREEDLDGDSRAFLRRIAARYPTAVAYRRLGALTVEALTQLITDAEFPFARPNKLIHAASEPLAASEPSDQVGTCSATSLFAAKTQGSRAVIQTASRLEIAQVILITSALGRLGSANAFAYALANGLQEDMALHARDSQAGPTVKTIALSQLTDIGMSAGVGETLNDYLLSRGLTPLGRLDALSGLSVAMRCSFMQVAVGIQLDHANFNGGGQAVDDTLQGEAMAPQDLEGNLNAIWCQLLKKDQIENEISVFSYGANSISVLAAYEAILRNVSKEVSISDLYEFPTVTALASHLASIEQLQGDT